MDLSASGSGSGRDSDREETVTDDEMAVGGSGSGGRPEPMTIAVLLRKLPSSGGPNVWRSLDGEAEDWTQRASYPHKKHEVTTSEEAPESPTATATAATGAATGPPAGAPVSVAPGFITQQTVRLVLDSVLGDFDPLTSLYTPVFRRKAVDELRRLLMDFGSAAEVNRYFGPAKTQRILTALSGAKHPDVAALTEMLSFVLDREVVVPDPPARGTGARTGARAPRPAPPKK